MCNQKLGGQAPVIRYWSERNLEMLMKIKGFGLEPFKFEFPISAVKPSGSEEDEFH